MKKEIIKPFDLEKAKAGAKLRTKSGYPVEIFKWDSRGNYPIKGVINQANEDTCSSWNLKGEWDDIQSSSFNLVIVEEVEGLEFWSDKKNKVADGYFIGFESNIVYHSHTQYNHREQKFFARKKQAKSALAMARISQIMANDIENFGGVVTDEEWESDKWKYVIYRDFCSINTTFVIHNYYFLAFHKSKQRSLFLKKYYDLVKDFLMID
jgi:hypothetical protein